eukprot:gene19633-26318_t
MVNDFLRNTGTDMHKKCLFLGGLARRMIETHLGMVLMINRDNYNHKRVDTSGVLIFQLFCDFYNVFRKQVRSYVDNLYVNGPWAGLADISAMVRESDIRQCFDHTIIEDGLKVLLKGNWAKENDPEKAGIVQDMNRISYMGYLSHLRRLNTPMSREIKIAQPRRLDTSQWGICCPVQSPDGASIGLDKHMSVLTYVAVEMDINEMFRCLLDIGCKTTDTMTAYTTSARVFINNDLFGTHSHPTQLVSKFKSLRRNGQINACCSIAWNYTLNEVYVLSEEGRLLRPLMVVRSGKLVYQPALHDKLMWYQLFNGANLERQYEDPRYVADVDVPEGSSAPLEFIDIEEANNCMIAMHPGQLSDGKAYTHCEIHPSTTLSLGMFNVTYYKSYSAAEEDDRMQQRRTFFCNPYDLQRKGMGLGPRMANELTVDENGMPKLNALIEQGDAILGKVGIVSEQTVSGKRVVFKDSTKIADKTIEGTIDKFDGHTCFPHAALQELTRQFNSRASQKLPLRVNKMTLWSNLQKSFAHICDMDESCWMDHLRNQVAEAYMKPPAPARWSLGKHYLTTTEIDTILRAYTNSRMLFLGVFPLDFQSFNAWGRCIGIMLCTLDVKKFLQSGHKGFGFVINTHKSGMPGEHWLALYCGLDKTAPNYGIYFYDSYGTMWPIPAAINKFMTYIKNQVSDPDFQKHRNTYMHQRRSSECSMFCIEFLVALSQGVTFEDATSAKHMTDEGIVEKRSMYFRPSGV